MESALAEFLLGEYYCLEFSRKKADNNSESISSQTRALMTRKRLAKETQQLSLNDLQNRTGMDRAQLSRLFSESAAAANPTIQTLERVASAFGKRVVLSLQDA